MVRGLLTALFDGSRLSLSLRPEHIRILCSAHYQSLVRGRLRSGHAIAYASRRSTSLRLAADTPGIHTTRHKRSSDRKP